MKVWLNISDFCDNETFEALLEELGLDRFEDEDNPIQSVYVDVKKVVKKDY